jgi:CRISPR-associated protein Cas2
MSGRLRHLIVAYDVETVSPAGRKRLRRIADICCAHGVRVQKSVFECVLEIPQLVAFIDKLERTIDGGVDSLRIYHLGSTMPRVEMLGRIAPNSPREPLII